MIELLSNFITRPLLISDAAVSTGTSDRVEDEL